MRSEQIRLNHEENNMKEKIKDNTTKIRDNKQLPYLVAKIVEVRWLTLQAIDDKRAYVPPTRRSSTSTNRLTKPSKEQRSI